MPDQELRTQNAIRVGFEMASVMMLNESCKGSRGKKRDIREVSGYELCEDCAVCLCGNAQHYF